MKKIFAVLASLILLAMTSCGSGGGGSSDGHNTEPNAYSITGQIVFNNTGLSGVTVLLSGANSVQTITDSNGYYSFTSQVNGNYIVTPSLSGYVFLPSGTAVTIDDSDKAGIDFTATSSPTPTYSISGNVSGAVSSGVTITLSGTNTASTLTDSSGNYSFSGLVNGSYTITPAKAGYTFSPTSISTTVNNANITGRNFTSIANTTPTYSISGTVSGAVALGVTITMTGTSTGSTTTDSNGNYSFGNLFNGNYTLTASKTGYSFSPVRSVTVNNANVTGQNFTATANTAPTYTISGKVSGAVATGVTITLTGASSNSTTTDSNGNYSFSGAANGSYTITPLKTDYIFSPTSISVMVNNANITGQNFTAATFIWTEQIKSGQRYWYSIDASSNGTKLATGVYYFGYIYTSTDSGNTWTERTTAGTQNWNHIASSSDGTKLAAVGAGAGGYIYTSTDSGVTWTQCTALGAHNWGSIASSSDGTKLAAAEYGGEHGGYIYTSTNSGTTWTEQTNPGSRSWSAVASSSDGTKLAATCKNTPDIGGTGYIYTSTDSGTTWEERTTSGLRDWRSIASSFDGTKLIAGENNGFVYISTDSGATWKQQTNLGIGGCWASVAMSFDGTILAAGDYWGYIFISMDAGATWNKQTIPGNRLWTGLAFSADGTKLGASAWDDYIWTALYSN